MDKAKIRATLLAHGFTIKEGLDDLKPYVYEAVEAILDEHSKEVLNTNLNDNRSIPRGTEMRVNLEDLRITLDGSQYPLMDIINEWQSLKTSKPAGAAIAYGYYHSDGTEDYFNHAMWHNQTVVGKNERMVAGYFVPLNMSTPRVTDKMLDVGTEVYHNVKADSGVRELLHQVYHAMHCLASISTDDANTWQHAVRSAMSREGLEEQFDPDEPEASLSILLSYLQGTATLKDQEHVHDAYAVFKLGRTDGKTGWVGQDVGRPMQMSEEWALRTCINDDYVVRRLSIYAEPVPFAVDGHPGLPEKSPFEALKLSWTFQSTSAEWRTHARVDTPMGIMVVVQINDTQWQVSQHPEVEMVNTTSGSQADLMLYCEERYRRMLAVSLEQLT